MLPIEHFWRAAARHPRRTAVIHPGGTLCFSELAAEVGAAAAALQSLDDDVDGRIGIGAANSVGHLVALLATLAAGKTWIPLNPRSSVPDLQRIVEFTQPQVVILDEALASRLGEGSCRRVVIEGDAADSLGSLIRTHAGRMPRHIPRQLSDVQAIKFTGGTSGTPKGVMQSCRAWNTMIVSQLLSFGFNETDRFMVSAPLTHGSSTYVLPILGSGGCLVFPQEVRPGAMLDAIEQYGVTTVFVPPVTVRALVEENATRGRNTASLRNLIYGAAPMALEHIAQAIAAFGPVLATTYGQTEAPQIISCLPASQLCEPRNMPSVGYPSQLTAVAIDSGAGPIAEAMVEGEIIVRGDLVMNGYWKQPEKTAETIVDGWLRTGDIGMFDERGFLFIKGRKSDVIITGGFNVYPSDVETALMRHPAVEQCCVLGLPDDKWGEAVHAAVVLRPQQSAGKDALIAYMKEQVGSVLAPKDIHFFDALPRTAVDKISKLELRSAIQKGS